jgi:hypothetical protein
LADCFEAFLVEVDDHHRPLRRLARAQHLIKVEGANAQFLDRPRVGNAQGGEGEQQGKRQRARDAEALCQA